MKFLTAEKMKEKPNFFAIGLVVFATRTQHAQTYATELMDYIFA
jgi:hypothetical protein